jgi:aspartate aminotransferase-like enzyme
METMTHPAKRDPFIVEKLYCPGPTPVPLSVQIAGIESSVYHRSEGFYQIFNECRRLLVPFFGSQEFPIILTCSGSGAMEAAVVNLTAPGDEVAVVVGGKFGQRWEKLCKAYQCHTEILKVTPGSAPTTDDVVRLASRLKRPKAIFIQANETSTGVFYPIENIAGAIRSDARFKDTLIVVDAVSALCAHPIMMQSWGLDCVVAGSQKGFGVPPGLAFIALSPRAQQSFSNRPRFYFDLAREIKGQAVGQSAWTPASTIVQCLHAALGQLHQIGVQKVFEHHATLARATHAAVSAMGLELLAKQNPSHALTAIKVPDGIDCKALLSTLRLRFGSIFAGGQDELEGKIIRLAHLGFVDRFHLLSGIAALEFTLAELGGHKSLGSGVTAAMQVMHSGL